MRHQTGEHEVHRVGIHRRRRTSRPRQSRGHPANERTAKRRTTSGISGHMQPLAPLIPGQDVRVRDTQTDTWQPAKVISTDVQPRSYNILTPTGNVLRRNRRHLRETTERHTFQQDNVDDTDDLTRRDDMQVVPPPCNSVLPQKKSVRFQLPQPEQYTIAPEDE